MKLKEYYDQFAGDYESVMNRFCGNEELLLRFLLQFPEDATYPELMKAVQIGDMEEIIMQSHTLKGVSANLGLEDLQKTSADLLCCVREKSIDLIQVKMDLLTVEYQKIVHLIQEGIEC